MTHRSRSLDEALTEIESGSHGNVSRIVVSRQWWNALSEQERDQYHRRCGDRDVELSVDDRISRHFVEVVDRGGGEPPLSTEHRV